MSTDGTPTKSVSNDNQSSGNRKTAPLKPPEQSPKCPRCDSSSTKFCYYNNYSLTQPRHFCKTCRRYWTKGGALRNVPIGGGCRKNKKTKSNSRLTDDPKDFTASSNIGGLKFFHDLSPSMDFQLGRLPLFSRLNPSTSGVYNPYVPSATNPPIFDVDASTSNGSLMGFNWGFNGGIQETNSINVNSNLASSIESLSFINQDLHWKLQQQRLGLISVGENQKDCSTVSSALLENQVQKPQHISFQNLEISKQEAGAVSNPRRSGVIGGNLTTEWFLENPYTPTTNNNNNNNNNNSSSNSNDDINNWNGIQAWNDLHQYSALPQ